MLAVQSHCQPRSVGLHQHAHFADSTNHLHLYVTTQTSVAAFDVKTSSKVSNSA